MLSTDEFKTWAKDVVLFCHITTRIEGRKDDDLLSKKGGNGFPYIIAMDAAGNVTGMLETSRDVAGFTAMIAKAKDYSSKKGRTDLSASEALDVLCFDVSVGNIDADGFRAATEKLKDLTPADRKRIDGVFLGKEIEKVLEGINGPAPELRQAAGRTFADMLKAGRAPDEDSNFFQPFYILMLDHAEAVKDAALFSKALEIVRVSVTAKYPGNPNVEKFFTTQDERLARLKGGDGEKDDDGDAEDGDDDMDGDDDEGDDDEDEDEDGDDD